jgi:hypothetical protein
MLKRYVLRSKVKIRDASDEFDVWSAWGSSSDIAEAGKSWNWARSGAVEPIWDVSGDWPWGQEDEILRDRRASGMGRRLLIRKGKRREYIAVFSRIIADPPLPQQRKQWIMMSSILMIIRFIAYCMECRKVYQISLPCMLSPWTRILTSWADVSLFSLITAQIFD